MKAKVLLVEDNAMQAEWAVQILSDRGFEVSWVSDGASAIRQAIDIGPDCILLDAQLPDIDGFSICRLLNARPDTRGTPIIMLTAQGAVEDRIRGLDSGASDYLPKPFDPGELEARIMSCIRMQALRLEVSEKNRELETLLSKFQTLATTDDLTGLCNRRRFFEELEREVHRYERYGSSVALLLIDIDHFKAVNDQYGHPSGDAVLRTLGVVLAELFRKTDLPARYGGEEFAVLLPETNLERALEVAERLRQTVEQTSFETPAGMLTVTISVGAAVACDRTRGPESLVRAADEALYRAKARGRNRVEAAEY